MGIWERLTGKIKKGRGGRGRGRGGGEKKAKYRENDVEFLFFKLTSRTLDWEL